MCSDFWSLASYKNKNNHLYKKPKLLPNHSKLTTTTTTHSTLGYFSYSAPFCLCIEGVGYWQKRKKKKKALNEVKT